MENLNYNQFQSGKKGINLNDYYADTVAKVFDIRDNKVFLGDNVFTLLKSYDPTTDDNNQKHVLTYHGDLNIATHIVWYDPSGDIHERVVQRLNEYMGGDVLLNHYIAILLWAQSVGIKRFYSDTLLSPGTIKIYEKLKLLGRNVYGPRDCSEPIDNPGWSHSEEPIYYIEL